jgi:formylglycine-generating enzyme
MRARSNARSNDAGPAQMLGTLMLVGLVVGCGTGTETRAGGAAGGSAGQVSSGGTISAGGFTASGGTLQGGTATGGTSVEPRGGTATGGSPAGGGSSEACPNTVPAAMVALPEGYSIDSTEVTRGQYQTWLDTNPATQGQIAACTSNADFAPEPSCMSTTHVCQGSDCCDHPQVCVDWCDAYAYCQVVGKRLCGKIGG